MKFSPEPLVNSPSTVAATLDAVDWDFQCRAAASAGLFNARAYHWYPATFIPEVPFSLIEILSLPGARVLDPFVGVGTTAFQAMRLGRKPVGTEICTVAVEISRCLWRLISEPYKQGELSLAARECVGEYRRQTGGSDNVTLSDEACDALRPWFADETFDEVLYLITVVERERRPQMRAAFRVALSSTLKAASAQDRGWGCVADNVLPNARQRLVRRSALDRFLRSLARLERDVLEFREVLGREGVDIRALPPPEEVFLQQDIASLDDGLIDDASFDMVVTSPPYAEMTDYCMAQRLSYYWLGRDLQADLAREIGARRKRFAGRSLSEYRAQMKRAAETIAMKLKPGGVACLVLPRFDANRKNHDGRRAIMEEVLADYDQAGMDLAHTVTRSLPQRQRHHNEKWVSIAQEHVYLFTRRR